MNVCIKFGKVCLEKLWLLLLFQTFSLVAYAEVPSELPQLRISLDGHTAQISQLEVTPDRSKILTVSTDKTLRIWNAESLELEDTIRVPIGNGFEGNLYALAISADGKQAAISGWTGFEFEKSISVYLVDLETGQFNSRISGFDEIVTNMRYGPNGKYLYAALSRNKGLRIVDLASNTISFSDSDYAGNTIGIEFLSDGGYASSSHDGAVRFYDKNNRISGRKNFEASHLPTAIRVTRDGRYLAIGFLGAARVEVQDLQSGELIQPPDMSCVVDQRNTPRVFWSKDSKKLFTYGSFEGDGGTPVYFWEFSNGNFGNCQKISTTRRDFGDMDFVDDKKFAFATNDPSVGVFNLETLSERTTGTPVLDFSDSSEVIRLSENADRILFPGTLEGENYTFDLKQRSVERVRNEASDLDGLTINSKASRRSRISGKFPTAELVIDGSELQLAEYEIANDVTFAGGGNIYVATEFGIVRYVNGELVARQPTPVFVESIALSADAQAVVAFLQDGTIRWYRSDNLSPFMSLFVLPETTAEEPLEWVAWVPDGFYVSSNFGDKLIGWHLNNGIDNPADFYQAVQYERELYRPGTVEKSFDSRGAYEEETGSYDLKELRRISPGNVKVKVVGVSQGTATIQMNAEKRVLDHDALSLYVNGIPVLEPDEKVLQPSEGARMTREFTVPLFNKQNTIRIEVTNGVTMALDEVSVQNTDENPKRVKGDLFIVGIGVTEFVNFSTDESNLAFPGNDADSFVDVIKAESAGLFNNIYSEKLTYFEDEDRVPTKSNIEQALELVTSAGPNDTTIVFLASHGISDAQGNYYFLPRDANEADANALLNGEKPGDSLVSWESVLNVMGRTSGKRYLVVDTCYARNVTGPQDIHSLAKRSASASFGLLSASAGDEESQELSREDHGLFTWSIMEAIKGSSDTNDDKLKSIDEIFKYSLPLVEQNRNREKGPQTPQILALPILLDTPIAAAN